jgi:hypothetical protein
MPQRAHQSTRGTRAGLRAGAGVLAAAALLVSAAAAPAARENMQRRPSRPPRAHAAVINGTQATAGTWPWLAFVANIQASTACSGTVIAPMVVLTAAHCAEDMSTGTVYPAAAFRVVTGSLDWTATAAAGQVLGVSSVEIDPGFAPSTLDDDAALLILDTPTQSPALPLADASDEGLLSAGTPVMIAGWGYTYVGETTPPTSLYWGSTVVQSASFCTDDEYADSVPFNAADAICTLDAPTFSVASCHGDSGGPLVATDAGGDAVEIGITSRGDPACNPDFPSVFTRVDAIDSWSQSVIAANPPPAAVPAPVAAPPPAPVAAVATQAAPSPKLVAAPAAGSYQAKTSQRGGLVEVSVGSGRGASARITLHFRLGCHRHPQLYTTTVQATPTASGAWRLVSAGVDWRDWHYSIRASFRAPSSIGGIFTVTAAGARCSSGSVAWTAHAA